HQRVQRAIREQDRAQHGLLGVEVVRRGDRTRRCAPRAVGGGDGRHGLGESRAGVPAFRGPNSQLRRIFMREHMFAYAGDGKSARNARRDYFFATTIVLIVAVTFSTTSTTTM